MIGFVTEYQDIYCIIMYAVCSNVVKKFTDILRENELEFWRHVTSELSLYPYILSFNLDSPLPVDAF
jgi:hypothetical protein